MQSISTPAFSQNYLLPGDTALCTITVTHSTQNLPYYPEQFGLLIIAHKEYNVSKSMALCKVYFTPYNSVEIWDKKDFSRLPRVWAARTSTAPQRVFIHRDSVPFSTKPAIDTITYDWQKYYQLKRIAGLPYLIQMAAVHPDTIKYYKDKDSIEVWTGSHGGQLGKKTWFGNTFNGTVTGKLRTTYIPDGQSSSIDIGLEGVHVAAFDEDLTYDDKLGDTHTNADGEFTISYSSWQSPLEGSQIELFVQYWSENLTYDIEVEIDPYWKPIPVLFNVAPETGHTWIGDVGTSYNSNLSNIAIENIYDGAFKTLNWSYKAYKFSKDNLGSLSGDFTRSLDILTESNLDLNTSAQFNSFYGNRINLGRNSELYEGTIWHEFGHFLMHQLQNGYDPGNTIDYDRWKDSHINAAWSEGWADGFAMICDVHYRYYDNESFYRRTSFMGNYYDFELRNIYQATNGFKSVYQIGCTILDLYDGPGKFMNIANIAPTIYNDANTTNGYFSVSPAAVDDVSLSFETICKAMLNKDHVGQFYLELLNQQSDICILKKIKRIFTLNGLTNPVNSYTNGLHQLSTDAIFNIAQIDGSNFNMDFPELSGNTFSFNFGAFTSNTSAAITDPLSMVYGANLGINANGNTGFGPGTPSMVNSTLNVYVCNSSLTINSSSKLEIGGTQLIGILTIKEGTSLIFKNGSTLEIKDNSSLIIESGANLVFEKGASFKLNGTNAVIVIKHGAKIQIGKDAVFNYSGDGFIKFETGYPVSTSIEAIGPNAQFKLVGGSFGSTSKKIIEITGGSNLSDLTTYNSPAAAYNLAMFSLQNGHIVLSSGSRIIVSGPTTKADLRSLDIRAAIPNTVSARHKGIVLNGQSGNLIYKVSLSDAETGIQSNNIYGGADIDVLQYSATRCTTALDIRGKGSRIQDADINNCITAIRLEGMDKSTRLYRSKLYYNTNGVYAINCVNNVIELYYPNIYNNYYGLNASNSQFAASCGIIKNNASSVQTNNVFLGANVYLTQKSNLILDPVMRIGAGKIDMGNVKSVSIRQYAAGIGPYINQSGSSLLTDIDYSIVGGLDANHMIPAISINAQNNLWGFTSGNSRSPINLIDFDVKHLSYQHGIVNVAYIDNAPISQFIPCGTGGTGGDDRMRGWISGEVTPIRNLPDKTLSDGRMLKETVQEGYNYFFDIVPNHFEAVKDLTAALNATFTEEDKMSWSTPITLINSQLIEAVSEGLQEGNIIKYNADSISYSTLIQSVINLQNKLLEDFAIDSQNLFVTTIAKASLMRILDNREASIQILNNLNVNLYPELNSIRESYLCMTNKEKILLEDGFLSYDSLYNCSNSENFSELPLPYIDEESGGELLRSNQSNDLNIFTSNPLILFPNPTTGIFSIKFKGEEAARYQIEIFNLMGKQIKNSDGLFLRENNLEFNLSEQLPGVYFLRMTSGNDVKIIKLILTKS